MSATSRRSSNRRGWSLAETLLSLGIISLVLSLGLRFLVPLLKLQLETARKVAMQQQAVSVLEAMRSDLDPLSGGGMSILQTADRAILALHEPSDVAQDGKLVWGDTLVLYHWSKSERVLTRSVWSDPSGKILRPAAPTRLDREQLIGLVEQGLPATRYLTGVERFSLEHGGASDASAGFPLTVILELSNSNGESRTSRRTMRGRLPL